MASRLEKEKFFAQLDSLDEETETESESETEKRYVQQNCRKRQKLNTASNTEDKALTSVIPVTNVTIATSTNAEPSRQSRHPSVRTITEKANGNDVSVSNKSVKSSRNAVFKSKHTKLKSSTRDSKAINPLFENLTFYFIPNDDVAKPRKLRIQSAISQGATWARNLEPGITHIIVDPDIPATAVAKYVKDNANIVGVPFVKMNWLIESLSHKSVRNPLDSRFQLKGAKAIANTSTRQPLPSTTVSNEILPTKQPIYTNIKDVTAAADTRDDELDQIVQSLKGATELPFDEEMDIDSLLAFSSGDEQADETSKKLRSNNGPSRSSQNDQSRESEHKPIVNSRNAGFQCMESNPNDRAPSPNDRTIAILQQMATYYDRTGDNWRTVAYRKAISALRKHDTHVKTAKQARAIFGIGTRLADKIEEIVTTDRLKRLDAVLSDPDDNVLQLFMGIYGVGIRQARAWMEQGYRTLDDIAQNAKLSPNQKIGIEHHTDFAQRIPRSEVKQHGDIVAQALKVANRDLQSIIGGSYRRGNADSGDIDVIITHPTATLQQLQTWVFDIIVPHLFKIDFLKCALATNRPSLSTPQRPAKTQPLLTSPPAPNQIGTATNTGSKFHGASQLPATSTNPNPPWRRIDLLLVPPTSIGAALIYFTGNDIFNRSLRLLASKKGLRLNQHGLYKDVMRGKGRVKITEGELVEGRSEKKIFEVLGVPWRSATERSC